ncbi:MAG: hypothetical protein RL227_1687 [Pseudomonadota bacterium]|jgi:hypothetical protein
MRSLAPSSRRPAATRGAALALGLAGALSTLGGCDGGGGNGELPPGSVDVTTANEDALARAVALATRGGLAGGLVLSPGGGAAQALPALLARSLRQGTSGRARPLALFGPEDEPCLVAGSTRTTLDDRDNDQLPSAGDRLTVVFIDCQQDTQETWNGTLEATLTGLAAAPVFRFSANVTLGNLSVSLPGQRRAVYAGDFALSATELSASAVNTRMVVGNQLAAQIRSPGFNDDITLRAGHAIEASFDAGAQPPGGGAPGLARTTAQGSVASAAAGGYVAVRTLQPLQQYAGDIAPRTGQIEGVGKNGSLQLYVLPAAQVRIELDADGNGVAEHSKTVGWDWLF